MKKRFNLNHLIVVCFTIIVALGLIYVPNTFASEVNEEIIEMIFYDGFENIEKNIKNNRKNKDISVATAATVFSIPLQFLMEAQAEAIMIDSALQVDKEFNKDVNKMNLLTAEVQSIQNNPTSRKKDVYKIMDASLQVWQIYINKNW
jgi:hypothetical protein